MGIERESFKGGVCGGPWGVPTKPCDGCKSLAASLFCRIHSAFLCLGCDTRIHHAHKSVVAARHERVWLCDVCEQAPAAVTCKADAAALCVTCDSDIHSANPLSRRHERVPVEPFFDSAESVVGKCSGLLAGFEVDACQDVAGACSWLVQNDFEPHSKMDSTAGSLDLKAGGFVFSELDRMIDFECRDSPFQQPQSAGTDGVVPVQTRAEATPVMNTEHCFDIDFCRSKLSSFSYPTTQSLSQSVSSSSLDVGVVPDGSSLSEISLPFCQTASADQSATTDVSNQAAAQPSGTDREARVSRYREKRKNRKFEKTIRYASRKAYAESRPRIKGRFAKRTDTDPNFASRSYGSAATGPVYLRDAVQYGVVPSF